MKARNDIKFDLQENLEILVFIINKLASIKNPSQEDILKVIQKNPTKESKILSKSEILWSYNALKTFGQFKLSKKQELNFKKNITMKKIRTISGVTVVTVLTKPFPCPGKCIFCPNDVRMPKSYLSNEPGAQRAERNIFDPYFQTFNRLVALKNIGHPTDKIELIILGGTWTHYPQKYQLWFVKKCFDAMNDFGNEKNPVLLTPPKKFTIDDRILEEIKGEIFEKTYNQVISKALISKLPEAKSELATWNDLFKAQKINENAKARCVGLVIETRPDEIDQDEVVRIRRLGATKVQIGIQSLNDKVLKLNKRDHDANQTRKAINLLRIAGFKIHAHWMPNLYGSNVNKDIEDLKLLFSDKSIKPDELKVYPCSLIESAELMKYYKSGKWKPYSEDDLLAIMTAVFKNVSRYCRITRVIRDIPGTDIVAGNKKTNFRQIAEAYIRENNVKSSDIRSREIKSKDVEFNKLHLKITRYSTSVSKEVFLEYITTKDEIAGFLRLCLPKYDDIKNKKGFISPFINELKKSAIIREVHVYGSSLEIGKSLKGKAQHIGLGKALIKKAEELASANGFKKISVISSIGTRKYYEKLSYSKITNPNINMYQHKNLS